MQSALFKQKLESKKSRKPHGGTCLKKKYFIGILLVSVFITITSASIVLAHPGGTDSRGGHYDHSTGKYHYHHGYHAHQHPNGNCPYDFDPILIGAAILAFIVLFLLSLAKEKLENLYRIRKQKKHHCSQYIDEASQNQKSNWGCLIPVISYILLLAFLYFGLRRIFN